MYVDWLNGTWYVNQTQMFIILGFCLLFFIALAFFLEWRTRRRFYNHEKSKGRKNKGKIEEDGILGGMINFDDDDDEADEGEVDGEGGFSEIFKSMRQDLDDYDPDADDEDTASESEDEDDEFGGKGNGLLGAHLDFDDDDEDASDDKSDKGKSKTGKAQSKS